MAKKSLLTILVLFALAIISSGFTTEKNAKLTSFRTNGMQYSILSTDNWEESDQVTLHMSNSLPICSIKGYITFEDDDLAWDCQITKRGSGDSWDFDLSEEYDGGGGEGYIEAYALTLDMDYFELLDGADFWIYSDHVEYQVFGSDNRWRKQPGDNTLQFYIPDGAIPLVTINTYETDTDDDFSFKTYFDWSSSSLVFDSDYGNGDSYVYGQFFVLKGRTHPYYSDSVGKIEQSGWFFSGNDTSEKSSPVYLNDFWPNANTFAFTSVFSLWSEDPDFEFATYADFHDWNDYISGTVWRNLGNSESTVGVQFVTLQTIPME